MITVTYWLFEHLNGAALTALGVLAFFVLFWGICECKWRAEIRRTRQTRSLMESEVWGNDERSRNPVPAAGDDCSVSVLQSGEGEGVYNDGRELRNASDAQFPEGGIPPLPGEA